MVRKANDGMKRIKNVTPPKRQKFDIDSYIGDDEFEELPLLDTDQIDSLIIESGY